MKVLRRFLLPALLSAFVAGCYQVPVTGRRAMNLVDDKGTQLTGAKSLETADVAVFFTRRVSLAPDQLERFADDFSERLRPIVTPEAGMPLRIDAALEISECTIELLDFLASCEPFGSGNPQPVWMLRDVEVARETCLVGDGHLKLFVRDNAGTRASAIAFNWERPQSPEDLHGRAIDLAVTLRKHVFMGTTEVEMRVVDVRTSGG